MPTEKALNSPPRVNITEKKTGVISYDWTRWFTDVWFSLPKQETYSVALNPGSVAANTTDEQTFTVTGIRTNDIITINKPTETTGLGIVNARSTGTDQIAVTFMNTTAGAIDAGEETYLILATRL